MLRLILVVFLTQQTGVKNSEYTSLVAAKIERARHLLGQIESQIAGLNVLRAGKKTEPQVELKKQLKQSLDNLEFELLVKKTDLELTIEFLTNQFKLEKYQDNLGADRAILGAEKLLKKSLVRIQALIEVVTSSGEGNTKSIRTYRPARPQVQSKIGLVESNKLFEPTTIPDRFDYRIYKKGLSPLESGWPYRYDRRKTFYERWDDKIEEAKKSANK